MVIKMPMIVSSLSSNNPQINIIMNTKEIKPKTLVAVLAAAIREDAETIAKGIVEKTKGDNVEYASLVESFILGKRDSEPITFSSFAETAFEQIKGIEKLKTFEVELTYRWRKKENDTPFERITENEFSIRGELDIPAQYSWYKSEIATGKNAYSTFEEFKEKIQRKLIEVDATPTEVNLPKGNK